MSGVIKRAKEQLTRYPLCARGLASSLREALRLATEQERTIKWLEAQIKTPCDSERHTFRVMGEDELLKAGIEPDGIPTWICKCGKTTKSM